jgi:hypothetical protein
LNVGWCNSVKNSDVKHLSGMFLSICPAFIILANLRSGSDWPKLRKIKLLL